MANKRGIATPAVEKTRKFFKWLKSKHPNFKTQIWHRYFVEDHYRGYVNEYGVHTDMPLNHSNSDFSNCAIWKLLINYESK